MHTEIMNPVVLLSMPGGIEWLILVLVVVLLFGAKKIPELARGLGKGVKDFKDAREGSETGVQEEGKDPQKQVQ